MILGNYSQLYFEYTDKVLSEQNNKIMNYKSKEEKKAVKSQHEQEKGNPSTWKKGKKVNLNSYSITVKDRIVIEILNKDIIEEKVCAIVNATSSDLGLRSQLSAIAKKGGYIVHHELEEHDRKNGKVE